METVAEIAGTYTAHALWCITESEILAPMVAYLDPATDQPKLMRMIAETATEGVQMAFDWVFDNPEEVSYAVIIYQGYVPLDGLRTEVLIVSAYDLTEEGRSSFILAFPLAEPGDPETFRFSTPHFLDYHSRMEPDWESIMTAFIDGFEVHKQGPAMWSKHFLEAA